MRLILRTGGLVAALGLLALATFMSAQPQASASGVKLSMDSSTITQGTSTTFTLEVEGLPAHGLGAYTVGVVYNPSVVTPTSCVPGAGTSECNVDFSANRVQLVGADAVGVIGSTSLGSITFRCDAVGNSSLMIVVQNLVDSTEGSPQPLPIKLQDGHISCAQPDLLGDVDCNGVVDSRDALLVLQYKAALLASLPCFHLGDVDQDGDIDSVDAALILQIEAGLIPQP